MARRTDYHASSLAADPPTEWLGPAASGLGQSSSPAQIQMYLESTLQLYTPPRVKDLDCSSTQLKVPGPATNWCCCAIQETRGQFGNATNALLAQHYCDNQWDLKCVVSLFLWIMLNLELLPPFSFTRLPYFPPFCGYGTAARLGICYLPPFA